MAPAPANALADGAAGAPPPGGGTVALLHTECDVVRGIGAPDNVNLSNNARGERVAVVTYLRGGRAGIYTFTGGRLTSVERGARAAGAAQDGEAEGEEEAGLGLDPVISCASVIFASRQARPRSRRIMR